MNHLILPAMGYIETQQLFFMELKKKTKVDILFNKVIKSYAQRSTIRIQPLESVGYKSL